MATFNNKSQSSSIIYADEKAIQKNKSFMVVYNHKTEKFSVRVYGKYNINEELVYCTN